MEANELELARRIQAHASYVAGGVALDQALVSPRISSNLDLLTASVEARGAIPTRGLADPGPRE